MIISFILIFGLILRLVNINQSLWFDEAINVLYARDSDLIFYLTGYIIGDFHPPGWFFVLWVFTNLIDSAELIVRAPSVVFGVLTIYFTYLIGKEFSKKIGLIAALLISVAPLHIYYSQEARPYALGALAVSISSYYFLKFLKTTDKKFFWFLVLANAFVLYSDYPAYFILIAQSVFLFLNFREKLFAYLKTSLTAIVLFSPAMFILVKQLISGVNSAESLKGWAEVVGGNDIKNVLLLWMKLLIGRISIENQTLYFLLILLVSLVYLVILVRIKLRALKHDYLFYWFIVPPVVGILISFFIPIFSYFRFLYILPAFYLLVAKGLDKFKGFSFRLALAVVVILQIIFSSVYLFNPKFAREDWKSAVNFWDSQGSVIYFENSEVMAPYRLYSKNNLARPALKKIPAEDKADINLELDSLNKVLLVEYLVDVTDPKRLVEKKLKESNFRKSETVDFRGVGFTHIYIR